MSAEQIGQLYELMHATKDVWRPVDLDSDAQVEEGEEIVSGTKPEGKSWHFPSLCCTFLMLQIPTSWLYALNIQDLAKKTRWHRTMKRNRQTILWRKEVRLGWSSSTTLHPIGRQPSTPNRKSEVESCAWALVHPIVSFTRRFWAAPQLSHAVVHLGISVRRRRNGPNGTRNLLHLQTHIHI